MKWPNNSYQSAPGYLCHRMDIYKIHVDKLISSNNMKPLFLNLLVKKCSTTYVLIVILLNLIIMNDSLQKIVHGWLIHWEWSGLILMSEYTQPQIMYECISCFTVSTIQTTNSSIIFGAIRSWHINSFLDAPMYWSVSMEK